MSVFRIASRTFSTKSNQIVTELFKRCENYFDSIFKKVNVLKCENGQCIAEMKIEEEHTNPMKGLHGGMSAALVDTFSSWALLTHERNFLIPSVSVEMHLIYLKGAAKGDTILIEAETLKAGKTLGYLKCTIKNKKTGDILVEATHTKYYLTNEKLIVNSK